MIDRTDRDIRQTPKTVRQETQSHTLPGPGIAVNHRKPALANLCMLDPPTEILYSWRHVDRLSRQLGRKGIPLQSIQGEEFLVHTGSISVGK